MEWSILSSPAGAVLVCAHAGSDVTLTIPSAMASKPRGFEAPL